MRKSILRNSLIAKRDLGLLSDQICLHVPFFWGSREYKKFFEEYDFRLERSSLLCVFAFETILRNILLEEGFRHEFSTENREVFEDAKDQLYFLEDFFERNKDSLVPFR